MRPGDLAVGEMHVLQMREMRVAWVLAVVHVVFDIDDDRVFQGGGVVMLLGAGRRGAVPLDLDLSKHLTGRQCRQQQRRSLIEHFGDDCGLVYALTCRLARLRVTGNDHFVLEALNHDLMLMTFLVGVADGICGKGTVRNQALFGAHDGHVCRSSHWYFPC